MRVFVAFLCACFTTAANSFTDFELTVRVKTVIAETATPETQGLIPFWKKKKKKKAKTSNRLKKKNRQMGKKFKRKNDDTLRR